MSLEPAATKRGFGTEAQEAGSKKAAGVVRTATPDISWVMRSFDLVDELRLKRAVARLNKENPDAQPIVLEKLTDEERAALLKQEKEWARNMEKVHAVQREAERQAKKAERALAPPPPPADPSKDKWQLDYEFARKHLETKLAREAGFSDYSFEAITRIPAMCFTDNPMPGLTKTRSTLQIFTVKVAAEGLRFPLEVFGMVAVRDKLDYSRNIIFNRTRDNSQTLTAQDQCLILTGPSRAVFYRDKVYVEAVLKVKGTNKSEDTDLSLLFQRFVCCEKINLCVDLGESIRCSCVSSRLYTSKISTLEFTCGLVSSSVEATITMKIVEGSWPEGLRCRLAACIGSLANMDILLLDSGEEVPVAAADNTVELSRRVVSVESYGQLIVRGMMRRGGGDHGQVLAEAKASFAPLDADKSDGSLDLGVCKLKVTIAWSRILLHYPVSGLPLTSGLGVVSSGSSS